MPTTEHLEVFICRSRGTSDIGLYEALDLILTSEGIKTKEDLNVLCGGKQRKVLYSRVERISKTHWNRIQEPKASIRAHYEKRLIGYKVYKQVLSDDYEEVDEYKLGYDKGYKEGYENNEYNEEGVDHEGYDEGFNEGRQEALTDNPFIIDELENIRINTDGSNCDIGDIVSFKSSNSTKLCRITGVKKTSISVIDIQSRRCNGFVAYKDLPIDRAHKGHLNFSRNLVIIGKCVK